tara:strand:- start:4275 stop:4631 length:357 start_codon:yes stop_codon:yes gene_type:complete
MSFRTEIRKIAKKITKLYQIEIGKKDLIDTGNLQRSFQTKITVDKEGSLDINVIAIDYFKYLNEPFDVSEDVFKSREYKRLEDNLIGLIVSERFAKIDNEFKSSDSVSYTFKFSGFGK